jgi:hypothetical protein
LTSSGKDAQTFKGRLVIAANGVTVSNLNLVNAAGILGYYDGNTYNTTVEKVNGVEVGSKILKFPAYTLMNSANGEYMAYDGNSKYVTGEASKKIGYTDAADADYFALKMVGNHQRCSR